MSDKVIAVINKPRNCQNCVWGIYKYSTPFSTGKESYCCYLRQKEDRFVEEFNCGDEVHLRDCPLISLEEHDKEIRNKAIEEMRDVLINQSVIDKSVVKRISEQMKEQ